MTYALYDKYALFNTTPLLNSTKALLGLLKLDSKNIAFRSIEGHWARIASQYELLENVAYNLALCAKNNTTLLFAEEDAFSNAVYAKQKIDYNPEIHQQIEKFLHSQNLSYPQDCDIAYLPDVILSLLDLNALDIKKKFSQYRSVEVHSGFFSTLKNNDYSRIYENLDLKMAKSNLSKHYYAHLLDVNESNAFSNGGKLFFVLADLGVDFILSYSLSHFDMLDSKRKQMCKAQNRDNIDIPILLFSQVVLLSLSDCNKNDLAFNSHSSKVRIF